MQSRTLAVYGAGGHGKVVADVAVSNGCRLVGFVDDGLEPGRVVLHSCSPQDESFAVLGNRAALIAGRQGIEGVALGIGNNQVRGHLFDVLSANSLELVTLIHPTAVVSRFAEIGAGTVVMALAVVNPSARIGRGCIVNTGAVVEHDVVVGDFAHVSPNATLAGEAFLGHFSHLGSGATVLPGVRVGSRCTVGAGAVVNRDVADGSVVAGVPARPLVRRSTRE